MNHDMTLTFPTTTVRSHLSIQQTKHQFKQRLSSEHRKRPSHSSFLLIISQHLNNERQSHGNPIEYHASVQHPARFVERPARMGAGNQGIGEEAKVRGKKTSIPLRWFDDCLATAYCHQSHIIYRLITIYFPSVRQSLTNRYEVRRNQPTAHPPVMQPISSNHRNTSVRPN